MSLESTFAEIYRENAWGSEESVSGSGSTLGQTEAIRMALPGILDVYGIRSVLDIPCGDFGWWPEMGMNDLVYGDTDLAKQMGKELQKWLKYIGADIVPEIIAANQEKYPATDFRVLDLVNDKLPKADLVFSRDCLGHLSNENVRKALANVKASGAKYFMATTYHDPKWLIDADIEDGGWRPINLLRQFGLGQPLLLLSEELHAADRAYDDKSLGLWKTSSIPDL